MNNIMRVLVCGGVGSLFAIGLTIWLQGYDRLIPAALIGLVIGSVCGLLDSVMHWAISWAVNLTHNRIMVGILGAVVGSLTMGGLVAAMLVSVGWLGDCWG